jgi:lipoyl(octanoyl) transferase
VAGQPERQILQVVDCGLSDYRTVLARQQELSEKRQLDQIGDTVLIVEHPPVVTLGARRSANKLLIGREELARRGVDLVEIRRGGGATVHNPGQLVFYPILHLQQRHLGITQYVRTLEAIGMDLLDGLGLVGQRRKGYPGLWVNERKIASIGVRVSRSVTRHGMALNVANDLSLFGIMIPCGLDGVEMTSAERELGQAPEMAAVKTQLTALLQRHFEEAIR